MHTLKPHKVALAFGGALALIHAIWAVAILIGLAKPLMDWVFSLHMISIQFDINPFSLTTAIVLVIFTGIVGYVSGIIFAWLWNWAHR